MGGIELDYSCSKISDVCFEFVIVRIDVAINPKIPPPKKVKINDNKSSNKATKFEKSFFALIIKKESVDDKMRAAANPKIMDTGFVMRVRNDEVRGGLKSL